MSIRSVQLSGLYFRVYCQWESSDIPYVYTRDTSDRLIEWLLDFPHPALSLSGSTSIINFSPMSRTGQSPVTPFF